MTYVATEPIVERLLRFTDEVIANPEPSAGIVFA